MALKKIRFEKSISGIQIKWDYGYEREWYSLKDIMDQKKVSTKAESRDSKGKKHEYFYTPSIKITGSKNDGTIELSYEEGMAIKPASWNGKWILEEAGTTKITLKKSIPIKIEWISGSGEEYDYELIPEKEWIYVTQSEAENKEIEEVEKCIKTEKESVIKARIGQGLFRDKLMRRWGNQCCVTGCNTKDVLRASHIIPWNACKKLRLSESNGLLLSAHLDALFDKHLISFHPKSGKIYIANKVKEELAKLGIDDQMTIKQEIVWPDGLEKNLKVHYEITTKGK